MDAGMRACGQPAGGARAGSADDERLARDLLARFFAGFGLSSGSHLDRLVERFLAGAAAGPYEGEAIELGRRALAAAEAELEAWFALALGGHPRSGRDALLVGRAAWRACGAAERWPDALLAQAVPPALSLALRAAVPAPIPPEQPGVMLEQPFEAWSLRDLVLKPRATRALPRRSAAA